ncbi:MAG: hypothetical protein AABX52_01325 [Nanoarchaeota archaeon]
MQYIYILVALIILFGVSAKYSPGPGYVGEPMITHQYQVNPAYPVSTRISPGLVAVSKPASNSKYVRPTSKVYAPGTRTLAKRLCPQGGIPMTRQIINEGRSGAWVTECVRGVSVIASSGPTFPPRESGWHLYSRFRSPELNKKVYS